MERGVAPKTANTRNSPDNRRRLAPNLRGNCEEIARKLQEEGFTGGLPAHNAREFRRAACPVPGMASVGGWLWMAVDGCG